MTAEQTLKWLRGRLPEAKERFHGLRYQPKGRVSMRIGCESRHVATAYRSDNRIGWRRRYLEKASGEELWDTLLHELIHLALPVGSGHDKAFLKYCEALGAHRYSGISLRKPNSYKTLARFHTKVEAQASLERYKAIPTANISHPPEFRLRGKRGDWQVVWLKKK